MKRILCYGDSNTWGTVADGSFKHCVDAYPNFLQQELGQDYQVISEGMPSRTAGCDDFSETKGNRNGLTFFSQCLISHEPIDYVVLFLGTNDLKTKFNKTALDVANTIEKDYILFTRNVLAKEKELSCIPNFIVVCPPLIGKTKLSDYNEKSSNESQNFDKELKKMAIKDICSYVSNVNLVCGSDGVHLTKESHKLLADKLAKIILSQRIN